MNTNQLIKALRRRLLTEGREPKRLIKAANEKQILDCFIRCHVCHEQLIAWPQRFDSIDAFFVTVSNALMTHPCTAVPAIAGIQSEAVQGLIDLRTIPEDACFSFVISREEIERQQFGRIQSQFALDRMPVGPALLQLRGRGLIMIDGFNHDTREVYEIQEIRQFYAEAVKRVPWLAFFLAPFCWIPILLTLMPIKSPPRSDKAQSCRACYDSREISSAVDAFVSGVAPVLVRAGLGNPEAKLLMEQMINEFGGELRKLQPTTKEVFFETVMPHDIATGLTHV